MCREAHGATRSVPTATPGEKGGLKVGDILITVGGKPFWEGFELQKVVASLPVGQPVEVALIRAGEPEGGD